MKNLIFKLKSFKTYLKAFQFHLKGYIDANSCALIVAKNEELELKISSLESLCSENNACANWCMKIFLLIFSLILLMLLFDHLNLVSEKVIEQVLSILQWPLVGLFIVMALTHHHEKLFIILDKLHPGKEKVTK